MRVAPRLQTSSRAGDTLRGVVVYLLIIIIGDRVQTLFGFVTPEFAGAHFLALSLAQRREWLRLAQSPSLTAS
jgi:hypothetical protein